MIKLFQFAPAFGLPNASPFCMKVETYLRMAGLPYECPRGADLRKAPKGKMPYIEDDGVVVADSAFIVDHLKRKYGDALDSHLGAAERAAALACQRMLEENTYRKRGQVLHSDMVMPRLGRWPAPCALSLPARSIT